MISRLLINLIIVLFLPSISFAAGGTVLKSSAVLKKANNINKIENASIPIIQLMIKDLKYQNKVTNIQSLLHKAVNEDIITTSQMFKYQKVYGNLTNGDQALLYCLKKTQCDLDKFAEQSQETIKKLIVNIDNNSELHIDDWRKPSFTDDGKVIPYKGSDLDSIIIINKNFAGKVVTKTTRSGKKVQVRYDSNGFPVFQSRFETIIDDKFLLNGKMQTHFQSANEQLSKELAKDPKLADRMGLSAVQVDHFLKKPTPNFPPKGLTWHHHQDIGRMQLVEHDTHNLFRHTGGMSIWGKRS